LAGGKEMNQAEMLIQHHLNKLKERSRCIDKQVVCVITDKDYRILSTGINQIVACDQNCDDKINRRCETVHAEIVACANLRNFNDRSQKAYLNLFPCVPCQNMLAHFVKEIIVFGPKHKDQVFENIRLEDDLYVSLLKDNETYKQISVAQGELCELVTTISDFFYRGDKKVPMEVLLDEIVDAELMIDQLKLICWLKDHQIYNSLKTIRAQKYLNVLECVKEKVYKNI